MLMIAAGYEDGNDADTLRADPMFKLAMGRLPDDADLCSQPTISRLENLPDARALLRMGHAMIDHYCQSFRQVPRRIVLDVDDTFDAVHGCQQLRLFNAHYDEYGFQPIVVFDDAGRSDRGRAAPGQSTDRPPDRSLAWHRFRSCPRSCGNWPTGGDPAARRQPLLHPPRCMRSLPSQTARLHAGRGAQRDVAQAYRHAGGERRRAHRATTDADGKKLRRFKEFYDGAGSWDRVERIIARVEAGPRGTDTRFIVTSLATLSGRTIYQDIYCARGQAENHIKAWKTHLAADRTSCGRATANQVRLFLHVGAYWLMWSLRTLMPRRSRWRVAQFDTWRLRLIKLAVRIEVLRTQVRLHLPKTTPDQAIFTLLLTRMPRLSL